MPCRGVKLLSRILLPCPHCRDWVAPEREHLGGWQGATSEIDARNSASFSCPACGEFWSESERAVANRKARLLHRDQRVADDGVVQGALPATDTLGFRWSAANNLFASPGNLGADEWRASRALDEENAEREMRQFVWCLPAQPTKWDQVSLVAQEIASRVRDVPRGFVPADAEFLTASIDLGKYLCHWIVIAWRKDATGHVVDYGRLDVASMDLGVEQALMVALRQFKDLVDVGWPKIGGKRPESPQQVWIDSGYMAQVVYAFCREARQRFRPAIGRGAGQQRSQWYNRPTSTGSVVHQIGEGFHLNFLPAERLLLVEVNADYWKTWVHGRLSTPLGQPGAMTLYQGTPQDHLALSKHLTAEAKTEEFVAGKGLVVRWERQQRQNHWFDAIYNACAAGRYVGAKLIAEEPQRRQPLAAREPANAGSGLSFKPHSFVPPAWQNRPFR